jgi:peptide-methionine (S)-S-oxide reductase
MIRLLIAAATLGAAIAVTGAASAQQAPGPAAEAGLARAIFASGCFWCTESDYDKMPGVVKTTSGYVGGKTQKPTYESTSRGDTGHTEAVEVVYDPKKVTYATLVEYFWRTTDVLDAGGQFCDRGSQYRPEIFFVNDEQRMTAEASKQRLVDAKRFSQPIVVKISPVTETGFTPAEDYHQDFYKKSPVRYFTYRAGCGRDARLQSLWGKEAGGKAYLTPATQ